MEISQERKFKIARPVAEIKILNGTRVLLIKRIYRYKGNFI